MPTDLAPEYVAQHVRAALAADPRTTEMGIEVRVVGSTLYLEGVITSPELCAALTAVASELAPSFTIRNEVVVIDPDDRVSVEDMR